MVLNEKGAATLTDYIVQKNCVNTSWPFFRVWAAAGKNLHDTFSSLEHILR